jgi:hypothetical protein
MTRNLRTYSTPLSVLKLDVHVCCLLIDAGLTEVAVELAGCRAWIGDASPGAITYRSRCVDREHHQKRTAITMRRASCPCRYRWRPSTPPASGTLRTASSRHVPQNGRLARIGDIDTALPPGANRGRLQTIYSRRLVIWPFAQGWLPATRRPCGPTTVSLPAQTSMHGLTDSANRLCSNIVRDG